MALVTKDGGVITQELWDSVDLDILAVQTTLFTVPIGQAGKLLYDTNMRQGGQLPKGWSFNCMAISWHVEPDLTIAGLIALSKGSYQLTVSDKVWSEGVLTTLTSGGGIDFTSDVAAGIDLVGRFGSPHSNNLKQLSRSIPIKATEGFYVTIDWAVAPGEKKFWFVLHGELQRGLN